MSVDVRGYYEKLTALPIGDIAREVLAGRITEESPRGFLCDCPRHVSTSKRSLHVSLDDGFWYCFGCGVGGDVLQLVEFVQHGVVTSSAKGDGVTDTHRAARDFLAQKAGVPTLSSVGPRGEHAERERLDRDRVLSCLTAVAQIYNERLKEEPSLIEWLSVNYGIDARTRDALLIGYADVPELVHRLTTLGYDLRTISATGAFRVDGQDHLHPFFKRRVVFPYLSRGRAVYMIGRRCPKTEDSQYEVAKYQKLPVHNDTTHAYVSPAIDNSILWGEDALLSRPSRVLVTEGVTDAIAARQAGFVVISPVTVRLKRDDVERIARKLRGVDSVTLIQDNEVSGVGLQGAIDTARVLEEAQIETRVAQIPLSTEKVAARDRIKEILGARWVEFRDAQASKKSIILREAVSGDAAVEAEVDRLVAVAKVDLCEWLRDGATVADVEAIIATARRPIEVAIDQAERYDDPEAAVTALAGVLAEIGRSRESVREGLLKRLKERTGVKLSILKSEASREAKAKRKEEKSRAVAARERKASDVVPRDHAQAGTLKEIVEAELDVARATGEAASYEAIANAAFEWVVRRGGLFFRTRDGDPLLFWENELFSMRSGSPGAKARYEGLLYELSGLVPTSTGSRTFYAALSALASSRGEVRESFPWIATDVSKRRVFFNLNNAKHEIARIDEHGVSIIANGSNDEGVILRGDPKFAALDLGGINSLDPRTLDTRLSSLIGRRLACRGFARQFIIDWLCALPVLEFAGTRPMLRLEGGPGSGKTWAAKMLTALVYGTDQQKRATDAANYADASRNPLIALDNIETANATVGLLDFLLTAVTGITREKRASGSDTAVVSERPVALILSTGIEPLGGSLEEILTRSVVVPFEKGQQDEQLLEKEALAEIVSARNEILGLMLLRSSTILRLIAAGGQSRAITAIRKAFQGRHAKSRCDEFLALMYLQRVAAAPEANRNDLLDEIEPSFIRAIERVNEVTASISREASPIVTAITALFTVVRAAPHEAEKLLGIRSNDSGSAIVDARTVHLFNALKKVTRDRGGDFRFADVATFGRRLLTAVPDLTQAGFRVDRRQDRERFSYFTIAFDPEAARNSLAAQEAASAESNDGAGLGDDLEDLDQNFSALGGSSTPGVPLVTATDPFSISDEGPRSSMSGPGSRSLEDAPPF